MKRYIAAIYIGTVIGLLAEYATSLPPVVVVCLAVIGTAAAFYEGGNVNASRNDD